MSRLKNFTRNLATGYLQLGVNVVYSLVSIPLILHWLPKAEFGLWVLLVQMMSYLVFVDLVDAVRMASMNPARALGLSGHKGSLEPQRDADIVVFSPSFVLEKTVIGGRVEYERPVESQ